MTENDENLQDVMDTLSSLAPAASDAPRPASQALARIKEHAGPRPRQMNKRRSMPMSRRRYALATMLAVLVLVTVFSIPGVRAAASDFLGLFRVQKFAPISISAEQFALLQEIADSGLYPGEIEMINEPGEPQAVTSLAEAQAAAGWQARSPTQLGVPERIYVTDGGQGRLTVNVISARAFLVAAGADPTLIPDSLEGAAVDVTIYPSISQSWSDDITLIQGPSPLVEYPADVDAIALAKALLQALGIDDQTASELASSIDWTNTLLLPIPENAASFSEVDVDGVKGIALGSLDGNNAALLWQREEIVYALSGSDVASLVDVANTLR